MGLISESRFGRVQADARHTHPIYELRFTYFADRAHAGGYANGFLVLFLGWFVLGWVTARSSRE